MLWGGVPGSSPGGNPHGWSCRELVEYFSTRNPTDQVDGTLIGSLTRCSSRGRAFQFVQGRVTPWSHATGFASDLALGTADTAASTARGATVIYGAGYKPTQFYPDNRTVASGFRWRVWSRATAIGVGTTKTCAPGNVHCSETTQTITYSRVRQLCGRPTFTRFRYSKWPVRGQLEVLASNVCSWIAG